MTSTKGLRTTLLTITGALALSVGLVGVTTTPGVAATTTFTKSEAIFAGDPGLLFPGNGSITVPASPATSTQGPGDPYGAEISVPHAAPVLDVDVEINLTHTAPDDLDLLLVGPGGQQALLMADSGSSLDVTGLPFVIDDEAADPLPDGGGLEARKHYRPANYTGSDAFAAPAPSPSGNTSLSTFDGIDAAGTWRLFVMDDADQDTGVISNWRLKLQLAPAPIPSRLDVGGLPPIADVDVTLQGYSSTYTADLDVLLVAPGGQQVTLMSDTGPEGNTDNDVSGIGLTFDDEAADKLPDTTRLSGGAFRPTDYDGGSPDTYQGGAPASDGNTALSVFDGLSPNGQWRLFVADDFEWDVSTITGWSLQFSFSDTQSPSGTVNIANGTATTSVTDVTLQLAATDPAPSNGVTHMRFSNDGTTFSAYQPYAATAAWTLTSGTGTKTVFAQFRDADGNESVVSTDTITLDTITVDPVTPDAPASDTTSPRAVRLTPAPAANAVKVSARVKLKASEPLRAGSVTGGTVFLKAKGSPRKVKAKVVYLASSRTIVLTPKHDLAHHTRYRITVKGVADLAGNAWDQKPGSPGAQPLRYTFITG